MVVRAVEETQSVYSGVILLRLLRHVEESRTPEKIGTTHEYIDIGIIISWVHKRFFQSLQGSPQNVLQCCLDDAKSLLPLQLHFDNDTPREYLDRHSPEESYDDVWLVSTGPDIGGATPVIPNTCDIRSTNQSVLPRFENPNSPTQSQIIMPTLM